MPVNVGLLKQSHSSHVHHQSSIGLVLRVWAVQGLGDLGIGRGLCRHVLILETHTGLQDGDGSSVLAEAGAGGDEARLVLSIP